MSPDNILTTVVGVATTNLSHVIEVGESRPGHTGNKRSVRADLLGGWSDCERQTKLPGAVFRGQVIFVHENALINE